MQTSHALLIVTQTLSSRKHLHTQSHTYRTLKPAMSQSKVLPASQFRPGLHKTIQTPRSQVIYRFMQLRCFGARSRERVHRSEWQLRNESTYLYHTRASPLIRSSNPGGTAVLSEIGNKASRLIDSRARTHFLRLRPHLFAFAAYLSRPRPGFFKCVLGWAIIKRALARESV